MAAYLIALRNHQPLSERPSNTIAWAQCTLGKELIR